MHVERGGKHPAKHRTAIWHILKKVTPPHLCLLSHICISCSDYSNYLDRPITYNVHA